MSHVIKTIGLKLCIVEVSYTTDAAYWSQPLHEKLILKSTIARFVES
jgi:hypothetical protein